MKNKKIAKQLRKQIGFITQSRNNLLRDMNNMNLEPFQQEDLRNFNEQIINLTFTHNYFSPPSKHI